MTTTRRITLTIAASPDGTKCAAECSFKRAYQCSLYGALEGLRGFDRHAACIAAESAAREAEVDALQRGYDIAAERVCPLESPRIGDWNDALHDLDAEIERVRQGES